MGFNQAVVKAIGGHRDLINLQQKEIARLREEFENFESATTQIFPRLSSADLEANNELEMLRAEVTNLQKFSDSADEIKKLSSTVEQIKEDNKALKTQYQLELSELNEKLLDLDLDSNNTAVTAPTRQDLNANTTHELREIRQEIMELKKMRGHVSKIDDVAAIVDDLKRTSGYRSRNLGRYNFTWASLFMFNLLVMGIAAIGADRTYFKLKGLFAWLPEINMVTLSGALLLVMVILNLWSGTAWRSLRAAEVRSLPTMKHNSNARLFSIFAAFVFTVAYLLRISI